jgi:lipoprotein signal peptidase|tara:strand:+ start:63 stop:245 length:183 start_codon:yes stop_codon:yes gene_type:complete
MKKWLISTMFKSKKFWYAVASIVVPIIVTYLGVDEETAKNLFYAALTLVLGQGIADSGKK